MIPTIPDRKGRGEVTEASGNCKVSSGNVFVKRGFAHMLKQGVIMDVTSVEQAQIAEDAGAVAVMVFDKLPYDKRSFL